MDLELRGRTAVVTGCSVGIGREIAREQFARQIPMGYFGDPSDIAYLVAFLCSPRARYITGERIHVDGGLRRSI
jgi:NAD(P)-dependent dehydrogenase (short-subunit alcohol dehydrogenase family)